MTQEQRDAVQRFVREHGSHSIQTFWTDQQLHDFVAHYDGHESVGVVFDNAGTIVGVGFARVLNRRKAKHFDDLWRFSEVGNCLHIQEICVRHSSVVPRLWALMVKRYGERRFSSGRRHGQIRVWDFAEHQAKMSLLNRLFLTR